MTKVKVQDATRELSVNAGKLLEELVRTKRRALDTLQTLKKVSDDMERREAEKRENEAKEALSKEYEKNAAFMNAYSSEQVPTPTPEAEKAPVEAAPEAPVVRDEEEVKPPAREPEKKAEPQARQVPQAPQEPKRFEGLRVVSQAPPKRPIQPQSQQPMRPAPAGGYNRPNQGPYGRPVQPGQGGPYGRPVNPQQGGAQGGPYGRPVQGSGGPYGRPVQPGQGTRPMPQGGGRPGGGMAQGGQRPPARGGAPGGRGKMGAELTPVVEKERVSNYDPNKKQYVRQNDPERTKNRRQQGNRNAINGFDDEFVRGKRKKKGAQSAVKIDPIVIEKAYMTAETITVKDLTERLGKPAGEIIKKLLLLGVIATINNELDYDTAQLVASEFGIEFEMKLDKTAEDVLEEEGFVDAEEDLVARPPVVTIMGHVDHGKTSLLDYIRKSRVTVGEAGGITQHIGAYTVKVNGQKITFLDTPGHEAFTAMRARGAQVTDIAILVVSADDGVMPQTVEAINHAKAAGVQIIIAINKIDKPAANPDRVKQELTEHGLVSEDWGGDTIMVPVSAVTGENVNQLLEMVLLISEMQNYRANPDRKARGAIVEARLDKGRGPVATVLIQNGTLRVGDTIVAGTAYGRVRAMMDDKGEHVKEAGPSDPVEVIGFNDVPSAGDLISAVDDDKLSRQVAEERKDKLRAALVKTQQKTSLDDLFSQISAGQVKDLNIIIKADVQGSAEAVRQSLEKLSNEEVRVRAIHGGVGAINEGDVMLASASNAIIIGFNVRHDNHVRDVAEREMVDIRLYRVIYNAIEDVEKAMKGLLTPKFKENILGHATVRMTFKVTGVGTIAGCIVNDGKIQRNAQARLLRDNVVIHESKVESLKRFKDDAREVATGYECGIGLENYNDVKEGDVIECFAMEEIEQ